jgi:hypothetical protein
MKMAVLKNCHVFIWGEDIKYGGYPVFLEG